MTIAIANCMAGTMYQYSAFAAQISQLANVGTGDPLTTSRPIVKDGYFPPASNPAIIGCDPETFFEIAAAFKPSQPRSCGRDLCAIRNLVAQRAISYSSLPVTSSGSVRPSIAPTTVWITC